MAAVGLTPQVVTETLYALVIERTPSFCPTEIHLITTSEGEARLRLQLLDPDAGALNRFATDHAPSLSDLARRTNLHVLNSRDGAALPDVASAEAGMAAADRILQVVRDLTADPSSAVCASLAGGRKTMGFLLGYAMSLFGRTQDRLTHVMVSPPFEGLPTFFYPPPEPRILFVPPDNRPVSTEDARITLTEIPFVRLRDGLPRRLIDGAANFTETVAEAQQALVPGRIVLDVARRQMWCGSRRLCLPPVEFAFVLWLARRRLAGDSHGGAVSWREADPHDFLNVYDEVVGTDARHRDRVAAALADGIDRNWLEQRVARVNKLLNEAVGLAAGQYAIAPWGQRPETRYGLPGHLDAIEIREKQEATTS